MSEVAATIDFEVNFTDAAVNKVASLILDEGDYSLNLRVYITGGGCSGLQRTPERSQSKRHGRQRQSPDRCKGIL